MSKMLQKLLAVGLALAFLLSMPGVSAIVEAASSAVLTAEQLEAAIVAGDGEIDLDGANIAVDHTLTIENTVTISNGTISRSKDVNIFDVKGNLTLDKVTLKGGEKEKGVYKKSAVKIELEGSLTMNNSTITGFYAQIGGGIYTNGKAYLNNGAHVDGNHVWADWYSNEYCYGGGIAIEDGGFVQMNDGSSVSNNEAIGVGEYATDVPILGGGIAIKEGGAFTMNGGEVNYNHVVKGERNFSVGGGICIGSDSRPNFKDLGSPDGSKIQLNAGTIKGNTARRAGGIYVHAGTTINVSRLAVVNNSAYTGGGVWLCGTGSATFYSDSLLANNSADGYGKDFYKNGYDGMYSVSSLNKIALSQNHRDGTEVSWFDEVYKQSISNIQDYIEAYTMILKWGFGDERNPETFVSDEQLETWFNKHEELLYLYNDAMDNIPWFFYDPAMVVTGTTTDDVDLSAYKLVISDNVSETEGGGIACNGNLIAGEKTGDLTVKKEVVGYDTGKDFSFKVTLDEKLNGVFGDMTFVDGVAGFNLKNGESLTAKEIPEGTGYTVEEKAEDGYNIAYIGKVGEESVGEDKGTIQAGKTTEVTVQNTWPVGDLTVSKAVNIKKGELTFGDYITEETFHFKVTLSNKEINGTFGNMDFENGEAEFDLKKGESKTATGLPANTHYTVTETAKDGYTSNYEGNTTEGDITANGKANASFVNTRKTGNLSVKKVVSAKDLDKVKSKVFNFTVKLDTPLTGTYGDMTFTDGEARFTLTHDETKTAIGLPTGIKYTVVEDGGADGYVTTYTGEVSAEGAPEGAQSTDENGVTGFTGEIAEGVATVTVKNTQSVGSLMVTKSVTGSGSPDDTFKIKVTLTGAAESGEKGEEINGQYGGMTFSGGVAEFNIKHSQSISADNLPIGLGYKVEEILGEGSDYSDTYTNQTGEIAKDTTAEVKVINDRPYGSLSISKAITGADYKDYKDQTFKFKVTGPGYTADKPLIVEIKGSGAHTLSHLIPGEYTIEEVSDSAQLKNYDWNGVKFTDANGNEITKEGNTIKVIVKADENTATEVVATNSYTSKLGKLTITK